MPKPHADAIEEQPVIACTVPISREKYHTPLSLVAYFEGGWLSRQLSPTDRSEQAILAEVGISSWSAE